MKIGSTIVVNRVSLQYNNKSIFLTIFPCCDIRYDFQIKGMFGSSLHPGVCRRVHFLFTLFVFACALWSLTHIVFFYVFVLRPVYRICCQFLWIVHS